MTNKEILLIKNAIAKLDGKLKKLDVSHLNISDYNKRYLKDYIDNYFFFMPLYEQLLQKVIYKLNKTVQESSFIDYGGGCGILSFLAVEMGFKTVIYNDIYEVSTNDVKVISKIINSSIDHFISGDIHELTSYINENNIDIDIISSFDVLEHIYDLDDWFLGVRKISKSFSLCFMTSANAQNPYINRRLKKINIKAEYIGSKIENGWKERDANKPFLEIRKEIIAQNFKNLTEEKILILAKNTRGLFGEDILNFCKKQLNFDQVKPAIKHPTNTCDPSTGNWAEHIIDLKELRKLIENENTFVKFSNSFYSYSNNKIVNIPKYLFNFLMRLFGSQSLFLSASYTLEIDYKN